MTSTFVHRYELDPSRPTVKEAARDIGVRGFGRAAVVWLAVVGIGFLITGPLADLPAENAVNEWFVDGRSATVDAVTTWLSFAATTESIIVVCVVVMALVLWRTRQWWFAIVPGLAVLLQAAVFLTSSLVVGRERPPVEMLDEAPPTSSFPSGHTGAAAAFWLVMALLGQRLRHPFWRVLVTVLCVLVPVAVGVARLSRGMHHLTDVLVGAANGVACALIAWGYLRRDTTSAQDGAVEGRREHAPA